MVGQERKGLTNVFSDGKDLDESGFARRSGNDGCVMLTVRKAHGRMCGESGSEGCFDSKYCY
jgi:hypothetical protein